MTEQLKLAHLNPGVVDGKDFDSWAKWEGKGLPLRDNCDPENPRQAFLWMFTAMPGVQGAPLTMPTDYWELQSWRMWILGARPSDDPQLKYQPPANVTANQWEAAGKWVGIDEPDPPSRSLKEVVDGLPQSDRAELKNIVLDQMGLNNPDEPDAPVGHLRVDHLAARLCTSPVDLCTALESFGLTVKADSYVPRETAERVALHLGLDDTPDFDPGERTVTEVREHLRNASPAEKGRVLAAERTGLARAGILKRYKEVDGGRRR